MEIWKTGWRYIPLLISPLLVIFLGVCFGSCYDLSRLCVQTFFVACLLLRLEIKLAKWVMCQRSTYSSPPPTVCWVCCSPWLLWTVGHTRPAIPRRPNLFQAASTETPVVKTETRHPFIWSHLAWTLITLESAFSRLESTTLFLVYIFLYLVTFILYSRIPKVIFSEWNNYCFTLILYYCLVVVTWAEGWLQK